MIISFFRLIITGKIFFLRYTLRKLFSRLDRKQILGEELKKAMLALGPLYIKIGQIIATRSDLFSREVTDVLKSLHDDVPPMSTKTMRKLLCKSYGKSFNEISEKIFREFSIKPIASASIAQVHRAVLHNGDIAAVKIVKYRIREQLAVNLALMKIILSVISWRFQIFRN